MCPQYGSSLSLDKQLYWLLEQKVLPFTLGIRTPNYLLRGHYDVLRVFNDD